MDHVDSKIPVFTFSNDCDTGFYSIGGGEIKVSTSKGVFDYELHDGAWFINQARLAAREANIRVAWLLGGILCLSVILKIMW